MIENFEKKNNTLIFITSDNSTIRLFIKINKLFFLFTNGIIKTIHVIYLFKGNLKNVIHNMMLNNSCDK